MPLFVWIKSQKRSPMPQVWADDMIPYYRNKVTVLQEHVITDDEAKLKTNYLAADYPYEGKKK